MASVSTNKLGSLAEQSVEEPTNGAPKLEAMVEVKFKVRQLAVLLGAEENVTTTAIPGASKTTTKTTVTTLTNIGKSENSNYGLAVKANGPALQKVVKLTTAPDAVVVVQRLQHEARQFKVENSVEGVSHIMGQKTDCGWLKNEAVQRSALENEGDQINNENCEFPVHDWGVPENFVVKLPKMLKFEQHLNEARRLENALVLVKPTKFLVFQQISSERILVDVMDDGAKMDMESSSTTNLKSNSNIETSKSERKISTTTFNSKSQCNDESKLDRHEHEYKQEIQTNATKQDTFHESSRDENFEEVLDISKESQELTKEKDTKFKTIQVYNKTCELTKKSFQSLKQKTPRKLEKTLTAALDLALLGQTKFQVKWKRGEEIRKSALKCYAKAQFNFAAKKSQYRDSISGIRQQKSFTKWDTSVSLELVKSENKISTKPSVENSEVVKIASNDVLKKSLVGKTEVIEVPNETVIKKQETVESQKPPLLSVTEVLASDQIPNALATTEPEMRAKISTFFDLKILEDDSSISEEEDSDTDCLSETKSSPEALLTTFSDSGTIMAHDLVNEKSNETLASRETNTEDRTKVQPPSATTIKPIITNDRFLVKLVEDLSSPEDDVNEQEVELLYLRKTPFIEEDDDHFEQLQMSAKPIEVAGRKKNKYLMTLLDKKSSSEEDLIDIDAESDDWDEELDPDIDRIEFFDTDDHDYDNNEIEAETPQAIQHGNKAINELIEIRQNSDITSETKCGVTKVLFGSITEECLEEGRKTTFNQNNEITEHTAKEIPTVHYPRFRVVPNTPSPDEKRVGTFHSLIHNDDEKPSCSKFQNITENFAPSTWYSANSKKIPAMAFENENANYESELESVLKKIRLLSEIDEMDQNCVYEEQDTEQRLYMKNGEWFATEPSESDEETRTTETCPHEKELQSLNVTESPRALISGSLSCKRFWMLSELRKRFGLRTAKYDPTKKRPGMIIDSENWEEAYSESTFWNAHKKSFEKVRVLAKKGRFKFAIISEAKRNLKVETSDEGEESDKSSSEEDRDSWKALKRKHSSFEIRQPDCQRNDDGEVFFKPIDGRSAVGTTFNDRHWALPPSRIYRFSRNFGRILKLYMKRPDLETILEEREPNDDDCDNFETNSTDTKKAATSSTASIRNIHQHVELKDNVECPHEDEHQNQHENGNANENMTEEIIENEQHQFELNKEEKQAVMKIRKKPEKQTSVENVKQFANSTENVEDTKEQQAIFDWYYCFYNDQSDEPNDEDYFGDLSDFE